MHSKTACKTCPYAALCVPVGSKNFFDRADATMGFKDGMPLDVSTMNEAIKGLTAFYLSLPRECPDHPAKEHARDVLAAMQAM